MKSLDDFRPFDLRDVMDEVIDLLSANANEKGLEFAGVVAAGVPPMLVGDAGQLRQVLVNLAGNALRFTSDGAVLIRADLAGFNGGVDVRFSVLDTGAGIPKEAQGRLFESSGNTGLGLPISHRLVSLMGGEISIASEPGIGSVFSFTAKFHAQPSAAPVLCRKRKALVVGADSALEDVLLEFLRAASVSAAAATCAEALAALDASRYDLLIADLRPAEAETLALTRAVRSDPRHRDVRVMLIAPPSRQRVPGLSETEGIAILARPVRQGDFLKHLNGMIAGRNGSRTSCLPMPQKYRPAAAASAW